MSVTPKRTVTPTKKRTAAKKKAASNGGAPALRTAKLQPMEIVTLPVHIRGTSGMIQNRFIDTEFLEASSTKIKRADPDPGDGAMKHLHLTKDGEFGVPACALKKALLSVCHKDLGITKVSATKAVFVKCDDPFGIIPFSECSEPILRTDPVTNQNKKKVMVTRPFFKEWEVKFECELDIALICPSDFYTLWQRAGYGNGIGDWRPERQGECGRFEVVTDKG